MLGIDNSALLVVDIQGKLATLVDDSEQLIARTAALIQGARILGLPIVHLQQNPQKLGPTHPTLAALLSDHPAIDKMTFDGYAAPTVRRAIDQQQRRHWLVCGIEAHICVYQTGSALLRQGYQVELITDCVSSRSNANKQLGISKLASRGATLSSVEMCLYELVGDCRSPAFTEILPLIR